MVSQSKEDFGEKDRASDPSIQEHEHHPRHNHDQHEETIEAYQGGDTEQVISDQIPNHSNSKPVTGGSRLARILTGQSTSASLRDPGPPPDGGLTAWTQAAMGHLVIFNTWGFVSSFGVFQTYYTRTLGHSQSDISWVGSIQIFLLFFIGAFSGRCTDAGLFRPVFVTGYMLQLIGLLMTSLSTKYWQLFLAQGLCIGISNGLQFCPAMAVVSTYFDKNRSFAFGITATGAVSGGLIYPVIVQQLLPKIGFGWTMRVLAFVTVATGALATAFLKTRVPPRRSGPLLELAAFKEVPYVLYCIGMFLNFWGIYFAFFYVGAFGRNVIGVSYGDSINILLIMNGVGVVGRLLPAFLADRVFGPLNTIAPLGFVCGVLMFSWTGVHDRAGLIAFSAVYGLFASGIQSLFPAVLASLTTDLRKAGVRMGMCFSCVSVACLTGPPLAGALIQNNNGNYLHAQIWAGMALSCGALTLIGARIAKVGLTFRQRI